MKKPVRNIFRLSPLGLSLFVAALVASLVFLSCGGNDRFTNYRGVNLIEGYTLADWTPDFNDAASPAPANFGPVYMRYAPAGSVGPSGAEAYTLRTKNLLPNGDFEATVNNTPPAGWAPAGPGPFGTYVASSGAGAISGQSLIYTVNNKADVLSFNLNGLADGFLQEKVYNFRFAMRFEQATLSYEINEIVNNPKNRNTLSLTRPPGGLTSYSYPSNDFETSSLINSAQRASTGAAVYFHINTVSTTNAQSGQSGTIDNLRFIRSDLKYKTRLRLRQTDVKHPFLPSGSYRLSVFVRQDTEAGSGNVFAASRISLGINQNWVRPNGTPAAPGSFIDDTAVAISADPGWGNWTEVSVVFRNVQIDPPSTAEDYNIELTISATDSSSAFYRDCGSILISSPALEFLPDE